jgi:hypothetical protein
MLPASIQQSVRARLMKNLPGNHDLAVVVNAHERGASSVMTMIYLALFLVGGALLFFQGLKPVWQMLDSFTWQKTPCTIIRSTLERKESKSIGSNSHFYYLPVIEYSYTFAGNTYQSGRYNFWKNSATDEDKLVIKNNPAGQQSVCRVDPDNPAEAVFHPMIPLPMMILLFFGVSLLLAGGSGLVYDIRAILVAKNLLRPRAKKPSTAATERQQIVLQSKRKIRKGIFYVLLTATVIWNAFNLLFLAIFFRQLGGPTTDFISIFFPLVIGAILAIVTWRKYSSFHEPQLILIIHAANVYVGKPFDLEWQFSGRAKRVTEVRIYLEAYAREEKSTDEKQVGKTAQAKEKTLSSAKVADAWSGEKGKTTVTIPEDSPASLKDSDKDIIWMFRALWDTPKQTENQHRFSIPVWPLADAGLPASQSAYFSD